MTNSNETRTAARRYYVAESNGIFKAHFQPLNPKNGQPWQAVRRIVAGHDAYKFYVGYNSAKREKNSEVLLGVPPAFEVWSAEGWSCCDRGFSTVEKALAAIETEKSKSGK